MPRAPEIGVISGARLSAIAAAAAMGVAPAGAVAPDKVMWVAMCGGGSQPMPLDEHERDRCPSACHAACARMQRCDGEDEGD